MGITCSSGSLAGATCWILLAISVSACGGGSGPTEPSPPPQLTVGFPQPATGERLVGVERNSAIGCDASLSPPTDEYWIQWIVDGNPAVCESRPQGSPRRLYREDSDALITLASGGFIVDVLVRSLDGTEVERQTFTLVILAGH